METSPHRYLIASVLGSILAVVLLLAFKNGYIQPGFLNTFAGNMGSQMQNNDESDVLYTNVLASVSGGSNGVTAMIAQPLDGAFQSVLGTLDVKNIDADGNVRVNLSESISDLKRVTLYHYTSNGGLDGKAFYHEFLNGSLLHSYFSYPFYQLLAKPVLTGEKISVTSFPMTLPVSAKDDSVHHFFLVEGESQNGSIGYSDILELPPQYLLTRAAATKLFVEKFSIPTGTVGFLPFADVPTDSWFATYVSALLEKGYIGSTNEFRPAAIMTRAELLKLIFEIDTVPVKVVPGGQSFSDVSPTHPYYVFLESLANAGYFRGFGNVVSPDAPATRHFYDFVVAR